MMCFRARRMSFSRSVIASVRLSNLTTERRGIYWDILRLYRSIKDPNNRVLGPKYYNIEVLVLEGEWGDACRTPRFTSLLPSKHQYIFPIKNCRMGDCSHLDTDGLEHDNTESLLLAPTAGEPSMHLYVYMVMYIYIHVDIYIYR